MRQVAKRLKDGRLVIADVPDPRPGPGELAVALEASIISSGTERATLEVAAKGLLAKARARPEQAKAVIERARTEGLRSTVALVRQRLGELGPLGYSAAGVVVEAGAEVEGISAKDRVAIAGGGFANHAEIDVVPSLLAARVPDGVDPADAAFATVGSIAIHGFRQSGADLGSTVAVIGLGLIGQLAVRVALAAGARVRGIDLDPELVERARLAGAQALTREELERSGWESEADAVLICAATPSSDPVESAAWLARDRGIVVVVGDVGMEIPRGPFYEKELELRLARSYGPGRYDPAYELHGHDYPVGYARWTIQRNMSAFLELVSSGRLRPSELISASYEIADAERAFESLKSERPLAIALSYPSAVPAPASAAVHPARVRSPSAAPVVGVIGAGAFATSTLIPGLRQAGFRLGSVASATGLSAEDARQRFGFEHAVPDVDAVLEGDPDLVVIATRHDSHAELCARALAAGVPTYVEKPLALSDSELAAVVRAQGVAEAPLFVGFNRPHSPLAAELTAMAGPKLCVYRINAGRLDPGHWTNDPKRGGGRLKGEACHFIDFVCQIVGADPLEAHATGFRSDAGLALVATDNFTITLRFADGSIGSVHYQADAPRGPGKERFETSTPGGYALLDDFKTLRIWHGSKQARSGGRRPQKGFAQQFERLARVLRGEDAAPDPARYFVPTIATLAAARSLETGRAVPIVTPE